MISDSQPLILYRNFGQMGSYLFTVISVIRPPCSKLPCTVGSENRTCPVFEWSTLGRFSNGPVFEWSGFRMVWFSNGPVLEWSMLIYRPIENRTSKTSGFRMDPFSNGRISDPHCS